MPVAAVVINPSHARAAELRSVVRTAELRAGWDRSVWFETTPSDAGQEAATKALASSPNVVIVIGGDGTVRAVAEVLRQSHVPMAIVPTGTGNLLARNLGAPLTDPERSIAAAFRGTDRDIDVVSVALDHGSGATTQHVFLAMAGIGVDAAMAHHSDTRLKAVLGWLAYVPPIARSILSNKSFEVRVRVDGGRVRTSRAHTLIVGNCGVLTGDIVLMPAAVVDDGKLDVVMLRPGRLIGWTPIGMRLVANGVVLRRGRRRGTTPRPLPSSRTAYHRQGVRVEADFDQPQMMELDGDIVAHVTRARFELLPGALRLRT